MSGLGQSFYEEGKEEGKEEVIRKLLDNGCDVQRISSLTGYSEQQVLELLKGRPSNQ